MLTQNELKQLLHYDPKTGIFTWLVSKSGNYGIGSIAGYLDKNIKSGYNIIKIQGKKYPSHRLAWLYMEGYLPEYQIDHKNGIRDDNRWENLRHVTNVCNLQNQKLSSGNSSGFPGVVWHKRNHKWVSQITVNKKQLHLGYYNTPLDAALARFTIEIQCPNWTCNYRSELVKSILLDWPEFKAIERQIMG